MARGNQNGRKAVMKVVFIGQKRAAKPPPQWAGGVCFSGAADTSLTQPWASQQIGGIITGEKELTLQTPQSFFARVQIDAHFKNEAL